jgi:hypothetical protein
MTYPSHLAAGPEPGPTPNPNSSKTEFCGVHPVHLPRSDHPASPRFPALCNSLIHRNPAARCARRGTLKYQPCICPLECLRHGFDPTIPPAPAIGISDRAIGLIIGFTFPPLVPHRIPLVRCCCSVAGCGLVDVNLPCPANLTAGPHEPQELPNGFTSSDLLHFDSESEDDPILADGITFCRRDHNSAYFCRFCNFDAADAQLVQNSRCDAKASPKSVAKITLK